VLSLEAPSAVSAGSNRGYLLASEFGHKTQGEGGGVERKGYSQGTGAAMRGGVLPRDRSGEMLAGNPRGSYAGRGVIWTREFLNFLYFS